MAVQDEDLTEKVMELQRREYAFLSRFAQREREMRKLGQECAEAFHAFDDSRKDSLKGALVDPAVNLEIGLMRQRLRIKDQEIAQVREELQNAQYQPNSMQGKKLLDKCNHLQEENAEIARQLSEEKLQVLRIQLCAERRKRLQLRQRIAQLDQYAEKVDEENDKMTKKFTDLGQSLKEIRAEVERYKKEIEEMKSGKKRKEAAAAAKAAQETSEVPAQEPPPEQAKRRKKDKMLKEAIQSPPVPPAVPEPVAEAAVAAEDEAERKRRRKEKKEKKKEKIKKS
mmetsp:Transcript_45695/g.72535  ORF Transcript_45695/g.72535 Transcript_45695/m.72535 type:complete len:283 (-) Transcript_45695:65-913(-)